MKSAKGTIALVALSTVLFSTLISCGTDAEIENEVVAPTTTSTTDSSPFREARAANVSRAVSDQFPTVPTVLDDPAFSGISTSQMFFGNSDTVVVSGSGIAQELRAASIGVVSFAPVLHANGDNEAAIKEEIARLGASHVLIVGSTLVGFEEETEATVLRDSGTNEALAELTALQFDTKEVGTVAEVAQFTSDLLAEEHVLLVPAWEATGVSVDAEPLSGFPAQSKRDGEMAPIVLASQESGISAIATARAFGAEVRYMDYPDPRLDNRHMEMVAGLADEPLLALGSQFGSSERLSDVIAQGELVSEQLPGGGGLVFPGRRMIALYGHPSGPALGAMGEQPPAEAAARVQSMVAEYQRFVDEPVIPAFEIIATVASAYPGDDGNYSNEFPISDLLPYVDAITAAGGYAVLDLQPGRASFLEQAKLYEELLKRPNIGLALDPEWKIGAEEKPMARVGSAEATEINEVADWLAILVRENNLPQKAFVLHQFQLQMLRDREQINTDHIELAFVLHADGHGSPGDKFATWDALRQGLSADYFMAWKNFYDEDFPTFSPDQTYLEVSPRPWFVSYQ